MTIPRPEYPRPQFVRADWMNLNGEWQFETDDGDIGLRDQWYAGGHRFSRRILVPFAYQARRSGIGETDFHDIVWYEQAFEVPAAWAGQRLILHFGAVDYQATVWVNGQFAVRHEGGHVPFQADITPLLKSGANRITVRAEDHSTDLEQPRGKQYWEMQSASIFYTRTTGIWQTVWLEPVAETHLERFTLLPDIDTGRIALEFFVAGAEPELTTLRVQVSRDGAPVAEQSFPIERARSGGTLEVGRPHELALWSPEHPALYDLALELWRGDQRLDAITSYFGMRKISTQGGQVLLNNQPYMMRLVLDQGYSPESLLTYPSDEALRRDVELAKAMGFNGARKHQKVEEPRYVYWADKLGLLVWGEMANAYLYSAAAVRRITHEWQEAIARDFNHPSIVAWVPINESWGVPELGSDSRQIDHLLALYHLVRSLDPSRLVISNDGWEHARTDLLTIHDYEGDGSVLRARYASLESTLQARPARRDLYVAGFTHRSEPILVTEFGGIAYQKAAQQGWGYTAASDDADFLRRYEAVVSAILSSPHLHGFCYTQLTDVEQEINGLLTYDRQPKVDLELIRAITAAEAV